MDRERENKNDEILQRLPNVLKHTLTLDTERRSTLRKAFVFLDPEANEEIF